VVRLSGTQLGLGDPVEQSAQLGRRALAAIPTIIFHIGMEKTGTDSFQRFCKENSRALLGKGVLYPVHGPVFGACSHRPLVACYLPYRDLGMGQRLSRADVLSFLRGEIKSAKPSIVLISAEPRASATPKSRSLRGISRIIAAALPWSSASTARASVPPMPKRYWQDAR
jgi:hypothetical protein